MLKYDGPLVRKNRELNEFVHEVLSSMNQIGLTPREEWAVFKCFVSALLARQVPYSHPIYGALEPKGSVANNAILHKKAR